MLKYVHLSVYFVRYFAKPIFIDFIVEMGSDPTWAYFWPTVKKRPARLWSIDPGTFLPHPKRYFLTHREKIEKINIFRGNFPNPNSNHRWPTRPDQAWPKPQNIDPTRVKNFWPWPAVKLATGNWKEYG